MNKYKKIFKLNLLNLIYTPIILFFYITIFVIDNNDSYESTVNSQIFAAIFLFIPIVILIIINIFYIFLNKELPFTKKILLIAINFVPIISGILMLFFNKYFTKDLNNEFNIQKKIKKNSWTSFFMLLIMLLFAIIYLILDAQIKSDSIASETFAMLFVLSIFLFVFSYLVLIFYVINFHTKLLKKKILICIPFVNLFLKY